MLLSSKRFLIQNNKSLQFKIRNTGPPFETEVQILTDPLATAFALALAQLQVNIFPTAHCSPSGPAWALVQGSSLI